MPRNRVRTTEKAKWTVKQLEQAKKAISDGMSIRKASNQYDIPFSTLQERLKNGNVDDPKLGRKCDFSPEDEIALAEHVKTLSMIFYGMTTAQLRRTAYEYATRNQLKHRFNQDNKMAGVDWLYGFLQRHNISVRKPNATSIDRAVGFSKEEVNRFFRNLEEAIEMHKFKDTHIWNVHETEVTTVQDSGLIVAEKDKKRVESITSWERDQSITVVCAMSSGGQYVSPMFIFPREGMTHFLKKNGPPGSIYNYSKSGWITEELFMVWLKHFANFTHASEENKMLLILDNHTSHCTFEAYNFCKNNGIVMVSIPPHTSHRLQPLDVTFYSPLKAAYFRECDLFLKSRNLVKITPYDAVELFYKAYSTVATISKATSGFFNTGIHPLNPGIFTDKDFLVKTIFQRKDDLPVVIDNAMDTSNDSPIPTFKNIEKQNDSIVNHIAIEDNSPITECSNLTCKRSRRKQYLEIPTTTPMKEKLEENKIKKQEKNITKKVKLKKQNKCVNPNTKTRKIINKTNAKKRSYKTFSSSDSEDSNDIKLFCRDESEDEEFQKNEHTFVYCEEFGIDGERWLRCIICGTWAHQACSGWNGPGGYKCDSCTKV